jgi:YggT family protein
MQLLMQLLSGLAGLYMFLIFVRIALTWFGNTSFGRPGEILAGITDPYLNWWRRILNLRIGSLDLSPVAALAALSLIQSLFTTIGRYGRISLGIVLAITLEALWAIVSFFLGFLFLILILCLIAYAFKLNTYSPFWQIIMSISRPVLFRINRIIFGKRLVNYLTGIIVSLVILAALSIAGGIAVHWGSSFLSKLII